MGLQKEEGQIAIALSMLRKRNWSEALIKAQVGVIASFCGKWKVYLAEVAWSYKRRCKKYALEKRNAKEYRQYSEIGSGTRETENGLF